MALSARMKASYWCPSKERSAGKTESRSPGATSSENFSDSVCGRRSAGVIPLPEESTWESNLQKKMGITGSGGVVSPRELGIISGLWLQRSVTATAEKKRSSQCILPGESSRERFRGIGRVSATVPWFAAGAEGFLGVGLLSWSYSLGEGRGWRRARRFSLQLPNRPSGR